MWLCGASNARCTFTPVLSFHQFVKRKCCTHSVCVCVCVCFSLNYSTSEAFQRETQRRGWEANSSRFLCSSPPQLLLQRDRGGQRSLMTEMEGCCRSLAKPEGREQKLWPQNDAHMQDDVHSLVERKHKPSRQTRSWRLIRSFSTSVHGDATALSALFSSCCSAVYLGIYGRPDRSLSWAAERRFV